jgi:hypothetical protein
MTEGMNSFCRKKIPKMTPLTEDFETFSIVQFSDRSDSGIHFIVLMAHSWKVGRVQAGSGQWHLLISLDGTIFECTANGLSSCSENAKGGIEWKNASGDFVSGRTKMSPNDLRSLLNGGSSQLTARRIVPYSDDHDFVEWCAQQFQVNSS